MARVRALLSVLQRGAVPPSVGLPDTRCGLPRRADHRWFQTSAAGGVSPGVPCRCVFGGMAPASDSGEEVPLSRPPRGTRAIGAPSAGLSLDGLRSRRAHLRFTRHFQATAAVSESQGVWGRKTGQRCSEGSPFFGLDNGVHLTPLTREQIYERAG